MDFLYAVLFGIIEGITEWLPISSTGHLIIVNEFIKFSNVSDKFMSMFDVVIQLGAIMAVVVLFFNSLWPFALKEKQKIKKDTFSMWFKILIACIPAAIIGLLFDEVFEELFYNPISVAISLIVIGIVFIIVENVIKKQKPKINEIKQIGYKEALIIGIYQIFAAIFPGTSRSGVTILGGLTLGLSRECASLFTFFLAIPVMFGASLLKGVKYVLDSAFVISSTEIAILIIATVVSFIASLLVINFLLNFVKKHDFKVFGYYRIVLGIIILLYFFL